VKHSASIDDRVTLTEKKLSAVGEMSSSNQANIKLSDTRIEAVKGRLDTIDKKLDDVVQESSQLRTRQTAQDKTIKVQNEMILNFQEVSKMYHSNYTSQFEDNRSHLEKISAEVLKIPQHDKLLLELQSSVSTLDVVGKKISDLAVSTAAVVHSTKEELAASVNAVEKKLQSELQSQPKVTSNGVDKGWQQVIETKLSVHEYQLTTCLNELAEFKKESGKLSELSTKVDNLKVETQIELKSIRNDINKMSIDAQPLSDKKVCEKVEQAMEDMEVSHQKHKDSLAKSLFDVKSDMMDSIKDFADGLKANLHSSLLALKADNAQAVGGLPPPPPAPVDVIAINKRIDALRYLLANRETGSLPAIDAKLELTDVNTICDLQTVNIHSVLKEVRQLLDDVKAESAAIRSDAEIYIDSLKSKLEAELMEKCHRCMTGDDVNRTLKEELLLNARKHIQDVHNNIVASFQALHPKGGIITRQSDALGSNCVTHEVDQVMQEVVRDYLLSLQTIWMNQMQQKCDEQIEVKLQAISEALWEDISNEKQVNEFKVNDAVIKEDVNNRSGSVLRSDKSWIKL